MPFGIRRVVVYTCKPSCSPVYSYTIDVRILPRRKARVIPASIFLKAGCWNACTGVCCAIAGFVTGKWVAFRSPIVRPMFQAHYGKLKAYAGLWRVSFCKLLYLPHNALAFDF